MTLYGIVLLNTCKVTMNVIEKTAEGGALLLSQLQALKGTIVINLLLEFGSLNSP